ncbi:methyl-accepting chemotaxis protein [Salinispirillum marinum]|uniref:Methyl-accepting chemotaxis protein n=2 Tax=Saccharospirillaceae TaxID=255527 RepID=A0ABV8BE41_9GAMM
MMKWQLNFRQSLWALLVLVVLGMATLMTIGIFGLVQQNRAFGQVSTTADQALDLLALEADIVQMELARRDLTSAAEEDFRARLAALPQRIADTLQGITMDTRAVAALADDFAVAFDHTLTYQVAVGLSPNEGQQGALAASAEALAYELEGLGALVTRFNAVRAQEKDFVIALSPSNIERWQSGIADFAANLERLGFNDEFSSYLQDYADASAALIEGRLALNAATAELNAVGNGLMVELAELARRVTGEQLLQAQADARAQVNVQRASMIFTGVLVATLLAGAILWLSRRLQSRIAALLAFLDAVASGDLRDRLPTRQGDDELGALAQGINHTVEALSGLVVGLQASNQQLQSMATVMEEHIGGLRSAGDALHERSDALASAMEEVSATTDQVAASAAVVDEATEGAAQAAHQGGQVIGQAIDAMQEIAATVAVIDQRAGHLGEHSDKIGSVLELINGIAEKTSLLALNAAIESARVGEAGRGFAVVADEVRTLAEQTAGATGDIGQRILGIQRDTQATIEAVKQARSQVELGSQLGQEALTAVEGIRTTSADSSQRMDEVRVAVDEVARTTSTMTQDMDHIATLVSDQQAKVMQLLAITHDVNTEAQSLAAGVSQFKV